MKNFPVLRAVSVETGRFLLEHIRTPGDCVAGASWRRLDAARCLGMAAWRFTAGEYAIISHVLVDVVFTLPDFTVDMYGLGSSTIKLYVTAPSSALLHDSSTGHLMLCEDAIDKKAKSKRGQ